jgi:hypothetical protein
MTVKITVKTPLQNAASNTSVSHININADDYSRPKTEGQVNYDDLNVDEAKVRKESWQ